MNDLKPSRELDALVAEKVMGYKIKREDCNSYWVDSEDSEPEHGHNYSESIADAWAVAEKLKQVDPKIYHKSRALRLNLIYQGTGHGWHAEFDLEDDNAGDDVTVWWADADTAPHCICLAALRAVGFEESK